MLKAPATASRAVTPDISQIGFQIREVLAYTRQYLLIPCCIFAVLLTLALSLHAERKRLILALLIFLTGLVSLLTYCLATYVIPRHMFFPLFFIAFSCFLLLGELFRVGQPLPARLLLGVLTVFFLFSFAEGILDIGVTWHKSVLREQEIRAALDAGETSISLETWQQYTKYATDYYLQTGSDPHVWPNQDIADYYGFEAVFGIPQSD